MIYIHENDYEFHFKFNICDFTYFRLTHSAGFWSSDSPYRAELPIIIFWVHAPLPRCVSYTGSSFEFYLQEFFNSILRLFHTICVHIQVSKLSDKLMYSSTFSRSFSDF